MIILYFFFARLSANSTVDIYNALLKQLQGTANTLVVELRHCHTAVELGHCHTAVELGHCHTAVCSGARALSHFSRARALSH